MFKDKKPAALTTGSIPKKLNLRAQIESRIQFTPTAKKSQVKFQKPKTGEILSELRDALDDCSGGEGKALRIVVSCVKCGETVRVFDFQGDNE